MEFEVGAAVSWTSQAGGNTRKKVGKVFAVVPAKTPAGDLIRAAERAGTHRSTYGGGSSRTAISYLVEVAAKTSKGLPVIYWPLTQHLKPAG